MDKISDAEIKKDIEEILGDEYLEEAEATIGENRGQLFIRLPRIVSQRLELEKGKKIKFIVKNIKGKPKLELEVLNE